MLLLILLRLCFFLLILVILVGIALKIAAWKVPAVRRFLHKFRIDPLDEVEEQVEDELEAIRHRRILAEDIQSIDQEIVKADKETISNFNQ